MMPTGSGPTGSGPGGIGAGGIGVDAAGGAGSTGDVVTGGDVEGVAGVFSVPGDVAGSGVVAGRFVRRLAKATFGPSLRKTYIAAETAPKASRIPTATEPAISAQ